MKHRSLGRAFHLLLLLSLGGTLCKAATLSLDLDAHTHIIHSLRLSPCGEHLFAANYAGDDGSTQFDTFALDVVHETSIVKIHCPTAGPVESTLLMAFSLGLFSANLALTGYPFGIGACLRLTGESVAMILQGARIILVPGRFQLWLFTCGVLVLLGVGYRKGLRVTPYKPVLHLLMLFVLALISPLGFAALDSKADLNGDAMVTSLDISIVASCFGQVPVNNRDCAKADVDEDGDIDGDDFNFVSERLGRTYPWMLYPSAVFPAGTAPNAVTLGDVNNDSALDIIVVNTLDDNVSVMLGDGRGSFQSQYRFTTGRNPVVVALGDVNGDGVLDAIVANGRSDDISVLLGNGDGSFQTQQRFSAGNRPHSIGLGDINADGILDVVVTNYSSNDGSALLGNGDGSFQTQQRFNTGGYPCSMALGDMNSDGMLDMIVANWFDDDVSVLLGNGNGSFQAQQRFSAGRSPKFVALGDTNADGILDVVVANQSSDNVSVLLGNGGGSFQVQQRFSSGNGPGSIALGDINGDGMLDVVATNGMSDDISVLLGNGEGGYRVQYRYSTGSVPRFVALGDVNNDRMLDVVVTIASGVSVLLSSPDK
jgi:hypothetical protein